MTNNEKKYNKIIRREREKINKKFEYLNIFFRGRKVIFILSQKYIKKNKIKDEHISGRKKKKDIRVLKVE